LETENEQLSTEIEEDTLWENSLYYFLLSVNCLLSIAR
jgi:hypothetical protein